MSWATEIGVVTLGETVIIISGEFDLSVGSVFGFVPVLLAVLLDLNIPMLICIPIILIIGLSIGVLNAFLTLRVNIPSFIATLGTSMIIRGLIFFITYGFVLPIHTTSCEDDFILYLINGRGSLINMGLIWYIILAIALTYTLYYTTFGNHIMGTGGDATAALYLGVETKKVKMQCFIISSLIATFAGLLSAARLRMGSPTSGLNMELEAIAAAVIGGTSLRGGVGSIPGAVFGSLIISMIRSGLVLAGAPVYWYIAFVGLILILASTIQLLIMRGVKG